MSSIIYEVPGIQQLIFALLPNWFVTPVRSHTAPRVMYASAPEQESASFVCFCVVLDISRLLCAVSPLPPPSPPLSYGLLIC